MNNFYKFIAILLPITILGCAPNAIDDNKVTKTINSLDMNIYSKAGEIIYTIASPYSSYDSIKDKFKLKKTTINIFIDGKKKYIINSNESTLSDNNKVVELKGNVKLKTIKEDEDYLYGDNFIWKIDETKYLLTGNIRFENKNVVLTSSKAKLDFENIIEFFNPVKYIIKDEYNANKTITKSENAYYNLDSESLSFKAKDKRVRSKIYF